MGTTRKASKEAEQRRISQIGDFKQRLGGITELPSGLVVKLFNPGGMTAFLNSKIIPNSLMSIVSNALASGQQPDPNQFVKDGEVDPKMMEDMMVMMDNIALKVIVEPEFHPSPATEADRSDQMLYIDELPLDDKQFLFQWVSGGTRDLETFRQKRDANVESLVAKSDAGDNPFLSPRAMRG